MNIQNEIPELVEANVISQDTADKILDYYFQRTGQSHNRLFIAFGIIGAILVGLGIVLILAHNWDELSRSVKTLFAFLPLIIGQIFSGYILVKKQDSIAWRESTTAFLFFAVGTSISLVSQIYNIPGDLSSFLLTWMLLCLPLIYIMRSSIASLLYLIGITYYAVETGYGYNSLFEPYYYWALLLAVLPHYYLLYKKNPRSNFMVFHNWAIPLSIIIALGIFAHSTEELMFVAYISLFGMLYLIGSLDFFKQQKVIKNSYLILGSLGTIVLLLILSFDWFWKALILKDFQFNEVIVSPEFFVSTVLTLLAGGFLFVKWKRKSFRGIKPIDAVFVLFVITFIIGLSSSFAVVLINIFVLVIGLFSIAYGSKRDHLGILNYGLLIITALVICRFFDTNLSFVIRGLLFISVGIGFFAANYWLLKKRKVNE